MRMPEPIPLGLTFRLAIVRAMDLASLVKIPLGGNVETVLTFRTHRFFFDEEAISCLAWIPCRSSAKLRPRLARSRETIRWKHFAHAASRTGSTRSAKFLPDRPAPAI